MAAHILIKSKKDSHVVTPILKLSHWLHVLFRIQFKILVLNLKTYHGVVPSYLCQLITKHHVVRALCSNDMMHLKDPKIRAKKPLNVYLCGPT